MNLKVLILCIGFSGLLYLATGSSEDAPNSNSVAEQPDDTSLEQHNLLELETKQSGTQKETPTTSHDINGRIGELEISSDTQTSVDITWTINDFFTLPYQPDKGILSPDFNSMGFKGFFVMDPKGSATTPGDLQFRSVIFRHDVPRGRIYFKLFLKMLNGTFTEFPVTVPFDNYFTSDISKLKIVEEKDILAPGGVLTVLFRLSTTGNFADNFKRECNCKSEKKELDCDIPSNPPDASSFLQLTTDGRIGELQLSENRGRSVDVIWKIPNVLMLPYRNDAGIISPDFDSHGFKGFFVMDPKGSMNTSGMISINSLIINKNQPSTVTHLQVFLKAEDGTLKTYYVPSVSFRNYFTCNVPKMDIIGDKEAMVPGGVLTVLFELSLGGRNDRNPEVTPSLASMYHVGDLNARRISSSKFAMTWVFQDFFSLPEYRQLTGTLLRISPDFFFHIYLTPKGIYDEAGFTRLQLSWRYTGDVPPEKKVPYPKFSCKFSLKTRENTLHNITKEKYHVALYGGFCYCLVPWSQIYERKDFLVPGGELALILNFDLESKDVEPETQAARSSPEIEDEEEEELGTVPFPDATETETPTTSHDINGRIGELEISSDTQTSVDITWTINDFFTLPYQPDKGILSPDFNSMGFKGFFVMDPKGSATTPGDLQFRSVIFRHDVPRGRIYFKLFLKMLNGTFTEFPVTVPFDNYFTSDISKLKIVEEKDILAPGGVLTVLFRLSTTGNFADNFKRECNCKSEKKELDCDPRILIPFVKMSSDFLGLYKTGAHSDATLLCGDKKFAVHKSILTVRSSVFADMFKRDGNGKGIGQILEMEDLVTLTDIDCSILDLLLQYIYSARFEDNLTSDEKEQLFEAAEKYGVE